MEQKRERILQTMEKLKDLLPWSMKSMLTAFCPDFRQLLINIEDEEIERYLNVIKSHIDYIENGDSDECNP